MATMRKALEEYEANLAKSPNSHPRLYHVLDKGSPFGDQWNYLEHVARDCCQKIGDELVQIVRAYSSDEGASRHASRQRLKANPKL